MAPSSKRKSDKARSTRPDKTITDPRFANIQTDPRFRLPSKKHTRVQLDDRFADILKDDFSQKAKVDRYGRKLEKSAGKKALAKFYRIEGSDDHSAIIDGELDDDDAIRKELERVDRKYDPARDGGFSSSSEDESDEEEDEGTKDIEQEEDEQSGEGDVPMGEVSSRIAAVNLDWDNVRAEDIYTVANSFVPPEGRILNVTVYPSEFGKERMEREEFEGPPKEIFASRNRSSHLEDESGLDSESEDEQIKKSLLTEDKGEEFNSTALRNYQLERLRYYYAVISCNSPSTAKALYDSMDGREYLSSANFFDLRFIPDEVSFDTDKPRDQCTDLPESYKPNEFVTDALTHSKLKLTWDADDNTRKEVQKRAFSRAEIDENDMKAYIGTDDSEESGGDDDSTFDGEEVKDARSKKSSSDSKVAAIRAALGLSSKPSKKKRDTEDVVGEMQVTFSSGLNANSKPKSVFENAPEETTMEKYVRKEKERKARRKEVAKASRDSAATREEVDTGETADTSAANRAPGDDDPFADPFFDDPDTSKQSGKTSRKEERRRARKERKEAEAAANEERANLELLMVDDNAESQQIRHFDMKEIEKAEKARKKKGKKGRRAREEIGEPASELQEGFKMDVADPRFASIFDNHEFAIDPTNPRYKDTEGMKALLEEGRNRRKKIRDDADDFPTESSHRKKRKTQVVEDASGGDDLQKLVERVKKKNKAR